MSTTLLELWQARHFIKNSIRNEFISRVVRSRLGLFWIILYPLAQVVIYAFVLSIIMAAKLPGLNSIYAYPIYLTAGILAWTLFTEILSRCLNIFIENGNLLKKMVFPRLALPTIVCGSALLNNTVLLASVLVIFALLGHIPSAQILWLPGLTLLLMSLALGLGLSLGILNVFFRDIGQVVAIILQFGFWLTPIVYSIELVSEKYRHLLYLNPMTGIVHAYQSILVYGRAPDLSILIYPIIFAAAALSISAVLYHRAMDEVVDVL
jgi:lipopolysaccharide transport system permease protein